MAKMFCHQIIYQILANDDPKEYPLGQDSGPIGPEDYSSEDDTCTLTGDGSSMTVQMCDCSDPKNYNFEDKGRFKI